QDKILYDVDDAQMMLNDIADTVKKIELVYQVDRLSKESVVEVSKVIHKRTEIIKENEESLKKNKEIMEIANQKQARIEELEGNENQLNHTIVELEKVNQVKEQQLEALEMQLRQEKEETKRLQSALEQKVAYIEEVHNTKVWKLYQKYKSIGFNRRKQ
ncbi:MAG: hypothetical protein J6F30_04985, partial [Cellulosilyticum sp.]|nr:hypothetical protein [Cellulosilyticum sp.]